MVLIVGMGGNCESVFGIGSGWVVGLGVVFGE